MQSFNKGGKFKKCQSFSLKKGGTKRDRDDFGTSDREAEMSEKRYRNDFGDKAKISKKRYRNDFDEADMSKKRPSEFQANPSNTKRKKYDNLLNDCDLLFAKVMAKIEHIKMQYNNLQPDGKNLIVFTYLQNIDNVLV
jgi:hypothetical protein